MILFVNNNSGILFIVDSVKGFIKIISLTVKEYLTMLITERDSV